MPTIPLSVLFLTGFNPLHCGAVVASAILLPLVVIFCLVSIPFIAGQWSLRDDHVLGKGAGLYVSIPFIAGQWSLRLPPFHRKEVRVMFQSPSLRGSGRFFLMVFDILLRVVFQSPSLRGSGRFVYPKVVKSFETKCFNPLHCGAVVASEPAFLPA